MKNILIWSCVCAVVLSAPAGASERNEEIRQLKAEIEELKKQHQEEIEALEARIDSLEQSVDEASDKTEDLAVEVSQQGNQQRANTFNPGIGVVLNGRAVATHPSNWSFEVPGFFVPDEGVGSGESGFSLDESELNLSANVDDKFYASATIALLDGSADVEEAYIQTTALPHGFTLKSGRFFSSIGYLGRRHTHTDDFAERPLPYEVFLGGQFGDDGISVTWVAPTALLWETGAEWYRGDVFPAAGASHHGAGVWTIHSHVGGDIGDSQSWRVGASWLQAKVEDRIDSATGDQFTGDSGLFVSDFVWKWAPHGNPYRTNLKVQGEYLRRKEDGDLISGSKQLGFDTVQSGWYLQTVYHFAPKWRVGARYARLDADSLPAAFNGTVLDDRNHNPQRASLMFDWSNSEFSRIRLQYNRDESSRNEANIFILQYIAAFGAHGAHSF